MSDHALTLDALLAMTPILNGQDLVRLAARHLFLCHVKYQPSVRDIFFPDHCNDATYGDVIDSISRFNFDQYAVLYVCQAICKLGDEYKIHTLLNEDVIDNKLKALYASPEWKKIGFALYTMLFQDLVRDETTKVTFKRYVERDGVSWAKRLCAQIRDKRWLHKNLHPAVTNVSTRIQYNTEMNILFVKLHLLDPTTVVPTFNFLSKALPDLTLELATTNYLGDPLEWTLIREDVCKAINTPSRPSNISTFSLDEVDQYFGIRVCEFVMLEPKEMGLWTGSFADNHRISSFRDRCVIS